MTTEKRNNIWNDIQEDVKKLYVGQDIETEQLGEIGKIVNKLWESYKAVKDGKMTSKSFNDHYRIETSEIYGIKYSDIMDIISNEYDKREQKIKEMKKQKRDDLVKKNAPNKKWQLHQMNLETNSSDASKIYRNKKNFFFTRFKFKKYQAYRSYFRFRNFI